MPTTTTYPASRRGHARHRALPASACALRDWGLSAAPPRDAGRMLPCAAYSHAYICHSHSCAYICIRIRIRIWAMAMATAMAMPGGWARCRGAAIIQRGVGQAGEADYEASWGQRKQVTRMRIAGRGRGFKRSACALTAVAASPPGCPWGDVPMWPWCGAEKRIWLRLQLLQLHLRLCLAQQYKTRPIF